MSANEYQRALDYLFARTTGGVRLGLERTFALLEALGDPQNKVPAFHVAGTNGKGSTVASIAALLRHKGMRVGTYTSPHLIDFRERIVVGGVPIAEAEVVRFIDEHVDLIDRLGATFFEATTALAFDHIARSRADVAVIETGLGGRLDSTNVVDPVVAVVTSIAMDHADLLGDTVEKIAAEKGGIFKRGRPAVIGSVARDVASVLVKAAEAAGASAIRLVDDEVALGEIDVSLNSNGASSTRFAVTVNGQRVQASTGLAGRHQAQNAMAAWLALDAAGPPFAAALTDLEQALKRLSVPGRFQRVGNVVFDVAHNPEGLATVIGQLRSTRSPRPLVALVGILSDKDWRGMLRMLVSVVDEVIATIPPTAPAERRWHLGEVAAFAGEIGLKLRPIADFDDALAVATSTGAATLITGSFHTVGDAMQRLQVNPLAG